MTGPDDSRMQDALRRAFLEDMGLGRDGAPATIGPYRVVEELGEGGGGRVFLAIHQDLLKRVALKVLDAGPGTPRARVERFRREATAAARLRHPNIVGVHDIGQDGSAHYIAMDLVEGGTLLDWIERKRPSLEERLRVVESVARAVACAHEAGVLHRDLKPLNILMRPEGDPVVVDFGLARQEDDESLTHEGAVMGTPAYMAPEQLRGALGELDARTDVYALGVILYQTVAGTVPYQGESSTALHG
ncbi:MAG: serine/threonine protein kinase, partial [Planctomycetes bacterium]|nr:serine/threonine protein kinase [Planctomycetota bacterium]